MKRDQTEGILHLDVQTFGEFCIRNEKGELTSDNIHSDMLMKLLTYIICHRNKNLTVQELIEILWPDSKSDNPGGALKNLMYRLRILLKNTWGSYDFILTGRGTYRWNPQIILTLDSEAFEECCKRPMIGVAAEEQIRVGKEAIALYKGSFLPELVSEYWVISVSTYYNAMYLSEVKKLAKLMEQEEQYGELEQLCVHELQHEPLDEELHCFFMRSLIAQKKYDVVDRHYKKTVHYFYESLGIKPSEKIEKIYEKMQEQQHDNEDNIANIREELEEVAEEKGAFFCEFGVFQKVYDLEKRNSNRTKTSICLLSITIRVEEREIFNEAVRVLDETMKTALRNTDIVCRYSVNQYLVLLPTCGYEDAKKVAIRLKNRFDQRKKDQSVEFCYTIDKILQ